MPNEEISKIRMSKKKNQYYFDACFTYTPATNTLAVHFTSKIHESLCLNIQQYLIEKDEKEELQILKNNLKAYLDDVNNEENIVSILKGAYRKDTTRILKS